MQWPSFAILNRSQTARNRSSPSQHPFRRDRPRSPPAVEWPPNRGRCIERGRFEQPDRTRDPAWAHPVIANGKLDLRDQDLLLCYDVKAE